MQTLCFQRSPVTRRFSISNASGRSVERCNSTGKLHRKSYVCYPFRAMHCSIAHMQHGVPIAICDHLVWPSDRGWIVGIPNICKEQIALPFPSYATHSFRFSHVDWLKNSKHAWRPFVNSAFVFLRCFGTGAKRPCTQQIHVPSIVNHTSATCPRSLDWSPRNGVAGHRLVDCIQFGRPPLHCRTRKLWTHSEAELQFAINKTLVQSNQII